MTDVGPLVEFFREEGAEMGRKGDYEGWTPEQTAIHFLREHLLCLNPPDLRDDWEKARDMCVDAGFEPASVMIEHDEWKRLRAEAQS